MKPEETRHYIINCVDENIRVELGKSTESAGLASFKALKAATGCPGSRQN